MGAMNPMQAIEYSNGYACISIVRRYVSMLYVIDDRQSSDVCPDDLLPGHRLHSVKGDGRRSNQLVQLMARRSLLKGWLPCTQVVTRVIKF